MLQAASMRMLARQICSQTEIKQESPTQKLAYDEMQYAITL